MRLLATVLTLTLCVACTTAPPRPEYPIQPVAFTEVNVTDAFWAPRIETNRTVTIPTSFKRCEETGRVDNFVKAAGKMEGDFSGPRYNDTDVYKTIEAAAYSLTVRPDPSMDKYLDELAAKIAAAQEEDGYLFTARTIHPGEDINNIGKTRWSNLIQSHELYNAGHFYEAAVAHYQATGKRSLLEVAIKNADLICSVFGPDKTRDVPGHQEIEIGLAKLYRVTGNERYLETARFFIDERGHANGRELQMRPKMPGYSQDHLPVIEQNEAVGHAVRAGYLYAGMADVAALTGDVGYVQALERIWTNVVSKKMYITGAVGASRRGESFGENYNLPNATAYNETCAAIANAMWNHRLFLLHGDAKYIDVLERVLYNGFLSGVSLGGDLFFYPNPLASDAKYKFNHGAATRQPWFRTSCCPGNVARFMPSIPGYVYARKDNELYVNLFVGGDGVIEIDGRDVGIRQQTRYPWEGSIKITINPESPAEFAVNVRIPGWARNQPVPSDLYRYAAMSAETASLKVNGEAVPLDISKGFVRIEREWQAGDAIELDLPMPVRRVLSHANVNENAGRAALVRGPVVYCVEGVDNGGTIGKVVVAGDAEVETEYRPDLLGGVTVIQSEDLFAIPYYAWSNRGEGEMAVWLPQASGI